MKFPITIQCPNCFSVLMPMDGWHVTHCICGTPINLQMIKPTKNLRIKEGVAYYESDQDEVK